MRPCPNRVHPSPCIQVVTTYCRDGYHRFQGSWVSAFCHCFIRKRFLELLRPNCDPCALKSQSALSRPLVTCSYHSSTLLLLKNASVAGTMIVATAKAAAEREGPHPKVSPMSLVPIPQKNRAGHPSSRLTADFLLMSGCGNKRPRHLEGRNNYGSRKGCPKRPWSPPILPGR